ncbi:hypothetical protein OH77DRAFT_1524673 [Trametes cingulata]|nr:hypothetical protein OH77DRAFT_1524673 [Trametes cingulata]
MPHTRAAASLGEKPPKAEVGKRAKAAATKAKKVTLPGKPARQSVTCLSITLGGSMPFLAYMIDEVSCFN